MSGLYRVTSLFYNDRWRNQSWWRRAWYRFWAWVDAKVWRKVLRPHVTPRTCIEEERRWWKNRALPHDLNAFVWREEEAGRVYWLGRIIERNGPWDLCCFQGETEEEVRGHIIDTLDWWEEKAGTRYPNQPYTVWWNNREPTSEDRTYTG